MGRGTSGPLWISLEGFLEESVLNLNERATGLALGPSHHRLAVTGMRLPSACRAQTMTLEGRREGCPAVEAEGLRPR